MIGALMLALAGVTPSTGFLDGNDLFGKCAGSLGSIGLADCSGYIGGASDMITTEQSVGGAVATVCMPENVTRQQVVDVVKRYLEANPQTRHYLAGGLVRQSLSSAFPCSK